MAEGASIAIEVSRRTARAVWVSRRGDQKSSIGLTIRKSMVSEIPSDLRPAGGVGTLDSQSLGTWLGEQLKQAGIPRGRVIIALPREVVGLKRMNLPTTEDAELPDMVRLALQRELPFDAAGMVIDFLPQERSDSSTSVLAVALPQSALAATEAMAKSAGLSIDGISLTTIGAAKLTGMTTDSASRSGPHASLLIDLTGDSIELAITVDGSIRFSRAAELSTDADRHAVAEAVITETRRTWTSYRTGDDAVDIDEAVLLGDQRVAELAMSAIEDITKVKLRTLSPRHLTDSPDERHADRLWPLLGLLRMSGEPMGQIDLANPRRAPDLAAQKRKKRLLAAAACVVGLGVLMTAANLNLKSLRAQAASLSQQQAAGSGEYARYWRDQYKLEHLKQWESSRIDWLDKANYLMQFSPPPDQVVLDSWSGSIAPVDVRYDSKTRAWRTPREVTIVLDGEARDRETADAFRARLVNESRFSTSSSGADTKGGKRLPFGFTYRLREQDAKRPASSAETKGAAGNATGGATP